MKYYIFAYLLVAIWLGVETSLLPHHPAYRLIGSKPWAFVVVDMITFLPVLLILVIADKLARPSQGKKE
ncbi:hypothetical protein WMW72_11245 [Paenibacillus filicis]|uniref:DUF3937 domain-containing protein n=1 Tax=Paenibacillus filicis TaxID=669464 RepID=A0ABU9DHX8_9BACL